MASRYGHGFFTRMFLRDCAFFIRWWGHKSPYWIWTNATYSFSATVGSVFVSLWVFLTISFYDQIPNWLNVFKLEKGIGLLMLGIFGALTSFIVDFCFKEFRDNVTQARNYMTSSDRLKWWIALFVTIGFPISMGLALINKAAWLGS